jgi:putative transposase
MTMPFEFFDPRDGASIREGNLPHWYQPGVTYFVTFRTEDSVPHKLLQSWHARRDDWLRKHDIDRQAPDWKTRLHRLPQAKQREFDKSFTREFMEYLDRGHGVCVLRRPELATIVANSLKHFDGQRYYLGDFVVMPNHVHLLTCLIGTTEIEAQCYSWKKFTAAAINKALGQHGRFWQEESFDHLVRSAEQFQALQLYIAENPAKANLRVGEYLHYRCAM